MKLLFVCLFLKFKIPINPTGIVPKIKYVLPLVLITAQSITIKKSINPILTAYLVCVSIFLKPNLLMNTWQENTKVAKKTVPLRYKTKNSHKSALNKLNKLFYFNEYP